jgi:hypothetical protein
MCLFSFTPFAKLRLVRLPPGFDEGYHCKASEETFRARSSQSYSHDGLTGTGFRRGGN